MVILKETSRYYAFLMKNHATIYEILAASKTEFVSDEASSQLYSKQKEQIKQHFRDAISLIHSAEKSTGPKINKERKRERKKEMEGKPID